MSFVLDASIALTWVMQDENHPLADLAFQKLRHEKALVPAIWWYEVRNMLIVNERRNRISRADCSRALQDFRTLRIEVESVHEHVNLLDLARQYRLSVYDAAYLELAIRKSLPLATLDRALLSAAEAAGVELLA